MRSLLALLRPAWLGLFGLHAIRGNVVAGKKSCLPAYFSGRMGGCGAALLLAAAAGGSVFDIRSNAQTATSAPAVAVDTITTEEAIKRARPGDAVAIPPGSYRISRLAATPNTILYSDFWDVDVTLISRTLR
jgi:hypothetical protein